MPVRIPVAVLVLVVGLTLGVVGLVTSSVPHPASGPPGVVAPHDGRGAERYAVAVLHDWDARRADAWATGDPAALSRLYTAASAAGRADVRLLQRYRARGLVVRGLRMQVLRVRVLVARPDRLRLEVTDRLSAATAVRASDRAAGRRLPVDRPSTHELLLRRVDGTWLMVRVSRPPASGRR
jgi:hypothetical protein